MISPLILPLIRVHPFIRLIRVRFLTLSCSSFHLAHPDPDGIGMGVEALGFGHADDVARGFLQALVGVLQDADGFGEGVNANG